MNAIQYTYAYRHSYKVRPMLATKAIESCANTYFNWFEHIPSLIETFRYIQKKNSNHSIYFNIPLSVCYYYRHHFLFYDSLLAINKVSYANLLKGAEIIFFLLVRSIRYKYGL